MVAEPKSRAWHERAEQFRILAQVNSDPSVRMAYLRVVQSCLQLAIELEAVEGLQPAASSDQRTKAPVKRSAFSEYR